MFTRKFFPILLAISFVMALVLSVLLLKPSAPQESNQDTVLDRPLTPLSQSEEKHNNEAIKQQSTEETPSVESRTPSSTLSAALQAVKDGKSSIISTIFNADDLNAQVNDLLALSEQGEAWADFAIGQVAEMCGYLYETPESQLIAMFTTNSLTANPEQQSQMSQLLPVVLDASKRCKTMDGEQLKEIGNPSDWFEKAAEANQASAFVVYASTFNVLRMSVDFSSKVGMYRFAGNVILFTR